MSWNSDVYSGLAQRCQPFSFSSHTCIWVTILFLFLFFFIEVRFSVGAALLFVYSAMAVIAAGVYSKTTVTASFTVTHISPCVQCVRGLFFTWFSVSACNNSCKFQDLRPLLSLVYSIAKTDYICVCDSNGAYLILFCYQYVVAPSLFHCNKGIISRHESNSCCK